jgi:hypothetical protein
MMSAHHHRRARYNGLKSWVVYADMSIKGCLALVILRRDSHIQTMHIKRCKSLDLTTLL